MATDANPPPRLLIVGRDMDRHTASQRRKLPAEHSSALRKVAHGVYIAATADPDWVFETYAIRINQMKRPNSIIAFSTAFYRKPTFGRVFVVGDYQYQQDLLEDGERYLVVQSRGIRVPGDARIQELCEFTDPMGTFNAWVHTPEMTLLNSFSATKRHSEKHLGLPELKQLLGLVVRRSGGRGHAMAALEAVADEAGAQSSFRRAVDFLTRRNVST